MADRCPTCKQTLPRKKGEKGATSKYKGVHQRGDGVWVGVVELPKRGDERRRVPVYSDTEVGAFRARRDLLEQLAIHGDIHTDKTTFAVWIEYWLEQIVAKQVAPSTYLAYSKAARRHLIPYFGVKTRLDKITAQRIRGLEGFITAPPEQKGLGLSSGTAGHSFAVLRRSLRDAHREGRIPENPCTVVDPPRVKIAERDALTVDEAIKVLQTASTDRLGAIWAIALLTGARRNEILGLTRDRITDHIDFSWQLAYLRVDEHGVPIAPANYEWRHAPTEYDPSPLASKRHFLTRPKSKAGWRIVPLVEPLKSILQRHLDDHRTPRSGLIFTSRYGGPLSPDKITLAWKRLLHEAGVNENVVLHGARHTTVDMLYMAGVPEDLIQEIVGHSTRGMTRSYKSKGNTARLTDAMERMSALLTPPNADAQAIERATA